MGGRCIGNAVSLVPRIFAFAVMLKFYYIAARLHASRKETNLIGIARQAMPTRFRDNRLSRTIAMSHAKPHRRFIALSPLVPIPAIARTAFTTQAVNMRAGRDRRFPLIEWLRP